MAKEVKAKLKLQIPGGGATPAPPVGSALGQYGVNIMDFVQAFNNDTSSRQGETVPVEIVIYEDNSFSFETKTAPASYLIKKAIGLESGSPEPHKEKVVIAIVRGLIPAKDSPRCENATNSLRTIFSPNKAPAAAASVHGMLRRYING